MSSRRNVKPWTKEGDGKLREYVNAHGARDWETMACNLGLGRSGNSCRLRWHNYLKPSIRRGKFTEEEKRTVIKLRHEGNGWSKIAKKMPGRTDNDIKNFCNSKRMKRELNSDVKKPIMLPSLTTIADPAGGTTDTSVAAASLSTGSSHHHVADYWPAAAAQELMTDHGSIESVVGLDLDLVWSLDEIELLRALLGTC